MTFYLRDIHFLLFFRRRNIHFLILKFLFLPSKSFRTYRFRPRIIKIRNILINWPINTNILVLHSIHIIDCILIFGVKLQTILVLVIVNLTVWSRIGILFNMSATAALDIFVNQKDIFPIFFIDKNFSFHKFDAFVLKDLSIDSKILKQEATNNIFIDIWVEIVSDLGINGKWSEKIHQNFVHDRIIIESYFHTSKFTSFKNFHELQHESFVLGVIVDWFCVILGEQETEVLIWNYFMQLLDVVLVVLIIDFVTQQKILKVECSNHWVGILLQVLYVSAGMH